MEKRVRKILSGGKVQGTDDLFGVENAESGDQEHAKKKGKLVITSFFFVVVVLTSCVLVFFVGGGVLPLLSNVMVVEGVAEMALKGAGKMVSVRDKSLKASAAEIGNSMLGLDGIESMENVKQILAKMQKLEGKVDAGFQRMDHKLEEVELLIKSRCGGGGPPRPRPPQSS